MLSPYSLKFQCSRLIFLLERVTMYHCPSFSSSSLTTCQWVTSPLCRICMICIYMHVFVLAGSWLRSLQWTMREETMMCPLLRGGRRTRYCSQVFVWCSVCGTCYAEPVPFSSWVWTIWPWGPTLTSMRQRPPGATASRYKYIHVYTDYMYLTMPSSQLLY